MTDTYRETCYDPSRHHRRSIRLKGYDYACPGAYFVTMVTHNRECLFSEPVFRRIAEYNWRQITRHFENVDMSEWIVMPNHIHGIIVITEDDRGNERTGEALSKVDFKRVRLELSQPSVDLKVDIDNASPLLARGAQPGALGAIVGNFKSVTTRRINTIRKTSGATIWQRNYYEHIARNERDLNRIREYIIENPAGWESDRENPRACTTPNPWLTRERTRFSKSNLRLSHV